MPNIRTPNLLEAHRRVQRTLRWAFVAAWGTRSVAMLLVLAISFANLALFFTATERPVAHAATASFTEDFATTTYRDSVNTTATWLGDGDAYMGYGSASSTRYFLENPSTGTNGFESVSCKDTNTCYLITSVAIGTVILRTTDAGVTWELVYGGSLDIQHTTSASALHDIDAVPGTDTVYAAGEETDAGLVLKSTDGGTTWSEANTGFTGTNEFQDVSCADASTCVVANGNTSGTRIWYTADGGSNWTAATTPSGGYALRGLDFISGGASTTWRAVGTAGAILVSAATTTPQGWTLEASPTGEELRDVEHLSSGAIHVVGGTAGATSFMASSTDAGASYATSTHPGTTWLWGIDCGDVDTCWTAGGAEAGGVRETMRTDDAGNTWTAVASNAPNNVAGGYLRDVAAIDGSTAYVAGGGTATWALVKTSTSTHFTDIARNALCAYDASGCTSDTQSISVRGIWVDPDDGQTAYVSGWGLSNATGKSTDGGESWAFTGADPGDGTPMDCATTQTCFIAGLGGFLARTTDGGASWTTQTDAAVYDAVSRDVDAVTTQMAWVGGGFGSAGKPKIVRTLDGGTTYAAATGTISSSFAVTSLYAISTTTAWVGGALSGSAQIYYTTDGGANWTQQFSNTGSGINAIHCLPNNQDCWGLWADDAGDDNIVKTADGGGTWTQLTDVIGSAGGVFSGMWFLDGDVGYVAADNCSGSAGKLYVTENGGSSWSRLNFPCMDGEIAFYRNRGVIGGSTAAAALLGQVGRIVHPFATSILQSTAIDSVAGEITCAGITPTQTLNGGTVTYEMSNDGGATWTASGGSCGESIHTYQFAFAGTGSDLRWRATMTGASSPPITTPEIESLAIGYSYNLSPDTPTNVSPTDGATEVLLTPTLTASAFSDADAGDTHASSRWEVSSVAGDFTAPVHATTSTTNLTSITIPSGTLTQNTTYYWHVKYVDDGGANSAYSTSTSFTTVGSGTVPPSTDPPTSPIALPESTRRAATTVTWVFQDTASNEAGFSIVSTTDSSVIYATTNPIFTQDISELTEQGMTPATEHCDRSVVAFNEKGNSPITASSTYPCIWTLPAAPSALTVATTSPTTITLDGIAADDNPADATYGICEGPTGLCLAPDTEGYVLAEEGVRQTRAAWGEQIVITGLHPETTYAFLATAFNGAGDATPGEAAVEATTPPAVVKFSVAKEVAVNPTAAALAGIAFAADFSLAALALMAVAGIVWYLALHRRSGPVRCVAGLCRVFRSHARSWEVTVADLTAAPSFTRHTRAHRFTQTTLSATLAVVALKLALTAVPLLLPVVALGQGDFTDDGQVVRRGDTMVYQIVAGNLGPEDATSFVVEDPIPPTTSFRAGSLTVDGVRQTDACDDDAMCVADGVVRLTRPTLAAGESTVITFAVTVTGADGETVENEGCVFSAELTTPTCSDPTANIIAAAPVNENVPTNENVNQPPPPTNENANAPAPSTTVNQPPQPPPSPPTNENANVNAPPEEPVPPQPPPPTGLTINGQEPSLDEPTNDATPVIGGRGEPGTLVVVSIDGVVVGVAFVGADGTWSLAVSDLLAEGVHVVTAAVDGEEFGRAIFVVDTVAPPAVADLAIAILRLDVSILTALTGARDQEATILVSGRTSTDTNLVRIRIESDPIEISFAPPSATWSREITARFDPGPHTVTAFAYDAAGNVSTAAVVGFSIPEPAPFATPLALLDDPTVERVSETVIAPAVVALTAVNVAVAAGIPTLFSFLGLLLTQPALLFARRERKGYGTVFNSLSKLPVDLAIVRVREEGTARVVQTKVTDRLGRYAFFLKPGRYGLEVTKTGFVHPTTYLAGKTEDAAYADVVPGTVLTAAAATRLAGAIPIDPLAVEKTPAAIRRAALLRRLQYAFALSGPVISVGMVLIVPSLTVIALALFQLVTFLLFLRLAYKKPPKSQGIVRDAATGKPLSGVVVRVFETTYQKLLETQVTDARGRYAFLVGPNRYYVTASLPGYRTEKSGELDFSSAEKGAVIAWDIALGRGSDMPPAPPAVLVP